MYLKNLRLNPIKLPLISEIMFNSYKTYWKLQNNITSSKQVEEIYKEEFINNLDNQFYILFDKYNNLIGFGCYAENEFLDYKKKYDNSVFISDIYVFNKFRKQGHASFIIQEIIKKIKEKDTNTKIYISVENDQNLLNFYKKRNFNIIDKYKLDKIWNIFEYNK